MNGEALLESEKRGSVPKRVGTLRYVSPPNASVRWQPDGLTIRAQRLFLGTGFLGAPNNNDKKKKHDNNDNNTNNNDSDNSNHR